MREVAAADSVLFVDAFEASGLWFTEEKKDLTSDGFQLNDFGYQKLAELLADRIFGNKESEAEENRNLVHEAVMDKNWFWHNDIKIPNGVHAYGRRFNPFGPDNYPFEIEKIRQMTAIRDSAIWAALKGKKIDVAAADEKTLKLPPVKTKYDPGQGDVEAGN